MESQTQNDSQELINAFTLRVKILEQLGFRRAALASLETYLQLLWRENVDLNLFSRKMVAQEFVDNHVIDCLLAIKHFPTSVEAVSDFGSGGGMPGLLYALQFKDVRFDLYEKSPLKRRFLSKVKNEIPALANARVLSEIPNRLDSTPLVIARAFKPVDVILEMSRMHLQGGGKYFLFKGRAEKIAEELSLAKKKWPDLKPELIALHSPVLDVERHLVVL